MRKPCDRARRQRRHRRKPRTARTGTANATANSTLDRAAASHRRWPSPTACSGQSQANSITTGGGVVSVSGNATAAVGSPAVTLSQTTVGGPVPTDRRPASRTGAIQSFAFTTGLPDTEFGADRACSTPHPLFNATLPNNGMSHYLGAASLGVARATTGQLQAYDTMVDFKLPYSARSMSARISMSPARSGQLQRRHVLGERLGEYHHPHQLPEFRHQRSRRRRAPG